MRQKIRRNTGTSPLKKREIDRKILRQSMDEIRNVDTLIGKNSVKWTFSKANRFYHKKPKDSSDYVNLKTTIGTGRKAGFGYGKRWVPLNPKGKDAPPPNTYLMPSSLDRKIIGGKISPVRSQTTGTRWSNPGPGTYEIKSTIGKALTCTFKSRHGFRTSSCSPPPGTYNPRHSLVESGRFIGISFGGRNSNENFARFNTPGPGSYDLGSTFSSISLSPSPKRQKIFRKNSI